MACSFNCPNVIETLRVDDLSVSIALYTTLSGKLLNFLRSSNRGPKVCVLSMIDVSNLAIIALNWRLGDKSDGLVSVFG